jgi:hypothetical protein
VIDNARIALVLWLAGCVGVAVPRAAAAQGDEPGAPTLAAPDEPGVRLAADAVVAATAAAAPAGPRPPAFRVELGFGLCSLLYDPDLAAGYGGGINIAWGMHRRFGVEASIYFGRNPYEGQLGSYGTSFLAGNISLGPVVQLTRPGSRFAISAELALGAYIVVPFFQEDSWTLGLAGGLTFALKITRNLAIGIKPRYHLFNLARISGPELKDIKALMKIGVIDRFELPGYLAFYF